MHIAIDCRMIGSGGIGSYLAALLPLFLKDNKCLLIGKPEVLTQYKNYENAELLPCEIKPFSIKDIFTFPKALRKKINECDVFYSPYCNIPNGIKIPVYSTIHDVIFLDIPSLAGTFGTFVRKCFYKLCIHRSTHLFTVSNFSKQRIFGTLASVALSHFKVPVTVTYNGLPPWFAQNVPANLPKEDYILFVGNIKKHKGLHTLIQAYKLCLQKGFTGKLMIVGNAENFRTADSSISTQIASLQDHVIFTGRISDAQLKETYCKAKLLVQPSLYEGFGMPPLEALSLGTNAVISDIPVFQEIYEKLPVQFFKCEDAEDLADKILKSYDLPAPVITENPYSFERTYDIIYKEINK